MHSGPWCFRPQEALAFARSSSWRETSFSPADFPFPHADKTWTRPMLLNSLLDPSVLLTMRVDARKMEVINPSTSVRERTHHGYEFGRKPNSTIRQPSAYGPTA